MSPAVPQLSPSPAGGLDGWPSPEDQAFLFLRDDTDRISGGILLANLGDSTGITIGIEPLDTAGGSITAHVHEGDCGMRDAPVVHELEPVQAGFSSSEIPVAFNELVSRGLSIGLHAEGDDSEHVACTDIARGFRN